MGIKTHLDGYPAEALGGLTIGVSPLEMADAYATIASGGYRNRPTAITKITFPDGKSELPRALQGQAHEGVLGRRHRRGDADPRGERPGRHRHEGQDRLPGGRQDRHHRLVQRRVVRRLHAEAGHRRLGRLPQRADRDEDRVPRRLGGRRHVPGRDLARLHDEGQGQVLRRLQAAQGAVPRHAVLRQVLAQRRQAAPARTTSRAAARSSTRRRRPTRPPTTPAPGHATEEAGTTATATATGTTRASSTRISTSRPRRALPPPPATSRPPTARTAARPRPPVDPRATPGINRASARPSGGFSMREGSARQHHLAH